ncbi:MAG TPA: AAA family ATPase [Streptosporangiaceae bacterium]|nr:AAA family ATPase [Streptosporangiaceae bacterium]
MILTGPPTVGKSTPLAALAAEFGRPVLDLDRADARAAAASAPASSSRGPVFVCCELSARAYLSAAPLLDAPSALR